MRIIFLILMLALVLTSCQEEKFIDTSVEKPDGIFLKAAEAGQTAYVYYFNSGKMEKFYYPENVLLEIVDDGSKAKVLNNLMLEVKDFYLLSNNEAVFMLAEVGSESIIIGQIDGRPIYDSRTENVQASKLPFTAQDYGVQTANGNSRFSGIIKSENNVLAINMDKSIIIYDIRTKGKLEAIPGSVQNDTLTFNVGAQIWTLRFVRTSPVGNIFELVVGEKKYSCYSLS